MHIFLCNRPFVALCHVSPRVPVTKTARAHSPLHCFGHSQIALSCNHDTRQRISCRNRFLAFTPYLGKQRAGRIKNLRKSCGLCRQVVFLTLSCTDPTCSIRSLGVIDSPSDISLRTLSSNKLHYSHTPQQHTVPHPHSASTPFQPSPSPLPFSSLEGSEFLWATPVW